MTSRDVEKIRQYFKTYHPVHALKLIFHLTAGPLLIKLAPQVSDLYLKLAQRKAKLVADIAIRYWARKKKRLICQKDLVACPELHVIGLDPGRLDHCTVSPGLFGDIPIADIDQDGFFLSRFGPLQGLPQVSKKEFIPRQRYTLQLVSLEGRLCIKKNFKTNPVAFLRECLTLNRLKSADCNVPSIINISFSELTLLLSFIPGHVLRERLAMAGAVLRDRDVASNPDFLGCTKKQRQIKILEQGHAFLSKVVDQSFVDALMVQVRKAHQVRVYLNDIKFGNIIIEQDSGAPYLIDFDQSILADGMGKTCFSCLRDRDIESINQLFQTDFPTHDKIKKTAAHYSGSVYAPAYIGFDLRLGGLGSKTVGYGRWHYFLKKNLPPFKGKRILDIGSNNGSNALLLLRKGAKQVIGIERNPKAIAQGVFLKQAFEWADCRAHEFTYIQEDMKHLPRLDLGHFDMVLALCSLYYLSEADMARVANYVATITDVFILQANADMNITRKDPHTYTKASLAYAVKVLKAAGFSKIEIIAPPGYPRPMAIGKK